MHVEWLPHRLQSTQAMGSPQTSVASHEVGAYHPVRLELANARTDHIYAVVTPTRRNWHLHCSLDVWPVHAKQNHRFVSQFAASAACFQSSTLRGQPWAPRKESLQHLPSYRPTRHLLSRDQSCCGRYGDCPRLVVKSVYPSASDRHI